MHLELKKIVIFNQTTAVITLYTCNYQEDYCVVHVVQGDKEANIFCVNDF